MSKRKLVVITGASQGLGLALCRQAVEAGYQVLAIARTLSSELEALSTQHVVFKACDLTDTAGIHTLCSEIVQQYGRPWGLVNNAGMGQNSILATLHENEIERLLSLNLHAPILMSKYLLRSMLLNQQGRIVNVTSIVANQGYNGLSVYAAAKAGLEGFTRSLAREAGKGGVTVNNLAPGYMATQMTAGIENDALEKIKRRSALRKLASVDDVAAAAIYLLSEQAGSVSGTTLTVDGGATA